MMAPQCSPEPAGILSRPLGPGVRKATLFSVKIYATPISNHTSVRPGLSYLHDELFRILACRHENGAGPAHTAKPYRCLTDRDHDGLEVHSSMIDNISRIPPAVPHVHPTFTDQRDQLSLGRFVVTSRRASGRDGRLRWWWWWRRRRWCY